MNRSERARRQRCSVVVGALVVAALSTVGPASQSAETVQAIASTSCTIAGTPRADRLRGTSGRDVICGRGGADVLIGAGGGDVLRGGDGADVVFAGAGSDILRGGDGADDLGGGDGNDDLVGGPQSDELDGGSGTNWCTVNASDSASRCVHDLAPVTTLTVVAEPGTVDVTNGDRDVTVRMHLTDDTGVTGMTVWFKPSGAGNTYPPSFGRLVEGDVRDGWWEAVVPLSTWTPPGRHSMMFRTWDRIGRQTTDEGQAPFEVLNDHPDQAPPQVTLLSPDPNTTVDVTEQGQRVVIEARIEDQLSGVDRASVHLWQPRTVRVGSVYTLKRVSGDGHDGVYRATAWIDAGAVSGNWQLEVNAVDHALQASKWVSATEYPRYGSGTYPFALSMGSFPVRGQQVTDIVAPVVESASLSPTVVDTLTRPATVHVTASVSDAGTGVSDYIQLWLVKPGAEPGLTVGFYGSGQRVSGTAANGVYEGDVTLPQGAPPGSYVLTVRASDEVFNAHQRTFVDALTVIDSSPSP